MYIHFLTMFRRKIVHTSGKIFDGVSSKNIFKPCSHIQKNTQNPNPIFKISIYSTDYTPNVKILSKKQKKHVRKQMNKHEQTQNILLFYNMYTFHNSYFVFFVYFCFFYDFCILCMFHIYTCRSLTRAMSIHSW